MLCSTILKFLIIFVAYNAVVFCQYQGSSGEYSGSFQNGNINSMYPNYSQGLNRNNSPSTNRNTRNDGYQNTIYSPNAPRIRNPSSSPSFALYPYRTSYTTQATGNMYTTEKYPSRPNYLSWSQPSARNTYRTAYTTKAPANYPSRSPPSAPNTYRTPYSIQAPANYLSRSPPSSRNTYMTAYTTQAPANYPSLSYYPSRSPPSARNTYRTAYTTQAPPDYKTEKYTFKSNQMVAGSIPSSANSSPSIRDTYNGVYKNPIYNPNAPKIRNPSRSSSFARYPYSTQAPKNSYTTEMTSYLPYHPSRSPPSVRNTDMTAFTTEAPEKSYTAEKYPSLPYHPSLSSPSVRKPYRAPRPTQGPPAYKSAKNTVKPRQTVGEQILRSVKCGSSIGTRISYGEIATLSEYPWMVLLVSETAVSRERFIGAGTLITNRYVLSAAHCVEEKHKVHFVRLGEHDLSEERDCDRSGWCAPRYVDVPIEKNIIHPDFDSQTLQSDVALIRLNRLVEFNSYIAPICLPLNAYDNSRIPTNLIVAGWGATETGSYSNLKRKTNVQLQPFEKCRDIFNLLIDDQICAGGSNGRNKCYGDSGGPLFAPVNTVYVQFGIVSGGSNKCGNELPGTYTNVSKYIRWIMNNIEY